MIQMNIQTSKDGRELVPWLIGALACVVAMAGKAGDWPVYRGPAHNGVSAETDWQSEWGDSGPKVLWRAEVGWGSSAVATSRGRVYTMGNQGEEQTGEQDTVYCFDAVSGRVIWKHSYSCSRLPKYYEGGTLATPTVDGDRVYSLSKLGDLLCLDAVTGKVIWERQLNRELRFVLPTWHFSSSPLVWGDRLILNVGSAGAAFDKHTGELLWENGSEPCGYTTPVPAVIAGVECVVIGGADSIHGIRVADGGQQWRYPFFNKHKATCGDPVVVGDEVFASSAYGRGCVKIRISGDRPARVFDSTVMRNLQSSCVFWRGQLYGFDETRLKCIDFADGRERWDAKGLGKGSLSLCADGRMLVMSDNGELVIARADAAKFDVIRRARVFANRATSRTAPVLSDGLIFLRNGRGDIACLDVRK